jgi:DNA polymerase bacteriophage-type
MTKLWLDLETYSETPITNGTHRYAADAEIMLFAWALDDGPVQVLDFSDWDSLQSHQIRTALLDERVEIYAHNSGFDRTVLRTGTNSTDAMRAAAKDTTRWRDTMVQALSHGLPGALGVLCDILKVPTDKAKDKEGKQLVQLFCKPRPATSKIRRATRETHPAEWAKFVEYARLDIEAMREVHKRLPIWNYQGTELALWHLDQAINDRGVAIDMTLVHAAIAAVDAAQKDLAERTVVATDGQVSSTTKRDALLLHVLEASRSCWLSACRHPPPAPASTRRCSRAPVPTAACVAPCNSMAQLAPDAGPVAYSSRRIYPGQCSSRSRSAWASTPSRLALPTWCSTT